MAKNIGRYIIVESNRKFILYMGVFKEIILSSSRESSMARKIGFANIRARIVPVIKALTFFALFMVLIQFVSDLLLKIDKPYGDVLLLLYFLGFPTAFTYFFMKFWNGLNFTSMGFKDSENAPKKFILGAFIGFCIISAFFISFYCFGYARVSISAELPEMPVLLQEVFISFIIVYNEELIFRGYIFNAVRKSGLWPSLIVSSVTFGFAHLNNPNVNAIAIIGLIVAGFLLAVSFLIYDEIWVPIGLHFMWNFSEEKIYGMPLSGLNPESWLFRTELAGSKWITGGDFGPEGGLLPIIIEVLVIVIISKFMIGRLSSNRSRG